MVFPKRRTWLLKKGRLANKCYDLFKQLNERLTVVESSDIESRLKIVAVNVSATNTNGSSAADETLVDGEIIGYLPVGNMDQLIDNIEVLEDGKVKVTLAAAATEQNLFKVSVLKVLPS
ncbi:hypothetical protein [Methanobacterium sp.]|uniref:hypothetical protein n=1 Tax=Methanobacterium sp. TaxID=2164 RepID=UPI003C7158F9